MTIRNITRRKASLPTLLLTAVLGVTTAVSVGADQGPKLKPTKADRSTPAVMQDIREGKAKKLHTPPERGTRVSGVWNCDHFVYLTTDISEWEFDDGSVARVSENPDPMPPREPGCVERNPTQGEMNAMHAMVEARNAGHRPPGAENRPLPTTPRARHLDGPG